MGRSKTGEETISGTRLELGSTRRSQQRLGEVGGGATHRGKALHDFDLGLGAKALRKIRTQLFILALLQFRLQVSLDVRQALLSGWIVRVQPKNCERVFDLDQAAYLSRLHGQRCLHDLGWQFVSAHGFVIAHVDAEIVLREFFRQQAKLLVGLGRLGLVQRVFCALTVFVHYLRGNVAISGRKNGNALYAERLRLLEACCVLIVIGFDLGQRYRGFIFHLSFQYLFDQERTLDLLAQHLAGTVHLCLHVLFVFIGTVELLAKISLGAVQARRRNCQLPSASFLIYEFLENDHLERTLADGGFLGFGKSIVLLGIRKNGKHLAQ